MRTRKSSVKNTTTKQKGEVWMKCTAKVTYSGGLGGIWKDAHLFGILSLGSACRTSGETWIHWSVLKCDLKNMPKKRDSDDLEVDEEECEYLQEEKSRSEWCLCYRFLCCNLFMNLYFDLIFKCFNLLYKKYILIYRPHWGTGTVTLAFSFLEDVI